MARYVVEFNNGGSMSVDDYKSEGMMIKYIEPYTHVVKSINASQVSNIRPAVGPECGIFWGLFQGPIKKASVRVNVSMFEIHDTPLQRSSLLIIKIGARQSQIVVNF